MLLMGSCDALSTLAAQVSMGVCERLVEYLYAASGFGLCFGLLVNCFKVLVHVFVVCYLALCCMVLLLCSIGLYSVGGSFVYVEGWRMYGTLNMCLWVAEDLLCVLGRQVVVAAN